MLFHRVPRVMLLFLVLPALLTILAFPAAAAVPQPSAEPALSLLGNDDLWDDRFGLPGTLDQIDDMAVAPNGTVYAVIDERRVVRWDGDRWQDLGETSSRDIKAITTVGNTLYVAGSFTAIGSKPVKSIARLSGITWEQIGSGVGPEIEQEWGIDPGTIETLAAVGTTLYIGGSFTQFDGVQAGSIIAWDDATGWSALGAGVRSFDYNQMPSKAGEVHTINAVAGKLYVGGRFQVAGDANAGSIAVWDGTAWSGMGGPLLLDDGFGGTELGLVTAIAVNGNTVYAGGKFSEVAGSAVNNIAAWNGSTWSALADGISGDVWREMVKTMVLEDGGNLLVGGDFTSAGGQSINHFARWTGSVWQTAAQLPNDSIVNRIMSGSNGDIYVSGRFSTLNDVFVANIAQRSGGVWQAFGKGLTIDDNPCCAGKVYAIADDGAGNVYVGGSFGYAGGIKADNIAKWDGTRWQPLGAGVGEGEVHALLLLGDELYIGGSFKTAGGAAIAHIAMYNTVTGKWSGLGSGVNRDVYTLEFADGLLYVGGDFSAAGGVTVSNIAAWDGAQWFALSEKLVIRQIFDNCSEAGSQVYAIKASGRYLAIAGRFHMVQIGFDAPCAESSYFPANNIVLWDRIADEWFFLGSDGNYGVSGGESINPAAYALEVIGELDRGGALYVGGDFQQAELTPTSGIARYTLADGWQDIGGVSGGIGGALSYPTVRALKAVGEELYVGGNFTNTSGSANYIARLNTTIGLWGSFGSGADNEVYAIEPAPDGLYIGGTFEHVGGKPAGGFSRLATLVSSEIITATGGSFGGAEVALSFPAGAVSTDTNVQYMPYLITPHPARLGKSTVHTFRVSARNVNGQPVNSFAQPYTMQVAYSDDMLQSAGVSDPATLTVARWNGSAWVSLFPCTGCSIDTSERVLTVKLNQTGEFALIGDNGSGSYTIYLPLLNR